MMRERERGEGGRWGGERCVHVRIYTYSREQGKREGGKKK